MKRRDLLNLWEVFSKLEKLKHDLRFNYFVAKNIVSIKNEVESITKMFTPSSRYIDYERERVKTAEKYADKNSSNQPSILNNSYVITEQLQKFEMEMKKIKLKYKQCIEERENQRIEYEKFLDEKAENPQLYKIKSSHLPPNVDTKILEVLIENNIIEDDMDL